MPTVLGFDWDRINRRKVGHHELEAEDIEVLFADGEPLVFPHPSTPSRFIALGFVPDGRFILVVFEHDPETRWVRVMTAYEPTNEGWWRRYEEKKRRKKGH
jgi:uncharacterized DUF497 family protein